MNFFTRIATVCAVHLGGAVAGACAPTTSPEQQVRAVLERAEEHAEARDLPAVMALVADGYADENGFDKARLRDFVRDWLLGTRGGKAAGEGLAEDWALAAEVRSFDLDLVREGEDWRLLRADRHGDTE